MTPRGSRDPAEEAPWGIAAPEFRLPGGTGIGGVRLLVEDLDRALGFWRDLLGLEVARREPGVRGLAAAGGPELVTLLSEEPAERRLVTPLGARAGLYHVALRVPERENLGRFLTRLEARAVPYGAADHAVSEALYLTDPDGHGVEVYADRPREVWRRRGRELHMVTEPLDAASLRRAASASRPADSSAGLSAGTTVGHVHLRVGDLDVARAFYHETLGMDLTVFSYPGALFFSAGGYHHHLAVNSWPYRRGGREGRARLVDWELRVPGADPVRSLVDRLTARGFPPSPVGDGWILADPEGIALRLAADA